MELANADIGHEYTIENLSGEPFLVSRLMELGFVRGEKIFLRSRILFGDPLIVEVRGTSIALRRAEANCIQV